LEIQRQRSIQFGVLLRPGRNSSADSTRGDVEKMVEFVLWLFPQPPWRAL